MNKKCSGFTLVELLVVVGIVGLLLSLLLPSLSKAREQARVSVCMNQQRGHTTAAVSAYAETNNDYIPPLMTETVTMDRPKLFDVDPTLEGLNSTDGEDYHHQFDIVNMLGFSDNLDRATCPSDGHALANPDRARVSYGINWFMYALHKPNWGGSQTIYDPTGDTQQGAADAGSYGPRKSDIISPSQQIFMSDQRQFEREPARAGLTWHWPEVGLTDLERHDGRFVASYHDGHVDTRDPLGMFGLRFSNETPTLLREAELNRGWPPGMPPSQPGGPDGADYAAYIFPFFAGWRGQPFQQDR